MKLNETKKRVILFGAAVTVGIFACVGILRETDKPDDSWVTMTSEDESAETADEMANSETRDESMSAEEHLPVSNEEAELLSSLYSAMMSESYVKAAQIMNDHEKEFEALAEETLNGEKYCYYEIKQTDGTNKKKIELLPESGSENGLVLSRYNTAFFGDFKNGKPEGEVSAIQTMILDEPRYTFASGHWTEGKMNGEGITGYHYYENAPESGFVYTEKAGNYLDNQLDGIFTYLTENGAGERLTWEIQAVNGATVITKDWTHYPFRQEYMLASKESEERAYVLTAERASAVIWNNLITWD